MATGAAGGSDPTLEDARSMEPDELLEAWRVNRTVLDAAASTSGRGCAGRLVRAVDGREVVPDGAVDGGVGPRPGRRRCDRCRARSDRSTPAHRPARIHHPRLELRQPRARRSRRHGAGSNSPHRPARSGSTGQTTPTESVVGPAEDFCLVVTQRRHVDATALVTDGDAARDWMLKAQAFAGGATDGPPPT